jgi:hypothetical protein
MRLILICILALMALPATAGTWQSYSNSQFGYAVAVPPGFAKADVGKRNADAVFVTADGKDVLSVWGMKVPDGNFQSAAAALMSSVQRQRWSIDDGGSAFDKTWFIFSATHGSQNLYEKAIEVCSGRAVAGLSLEYPASDKAKIWPLLDRLGLSIRSTKPGC